MTKSILDRRIFRLFLFLWMVYTAIPYTSAQRGAFTVVLDPGHGGKDPGAMAHGYREKDIALSIALKLGSKIKKNHPSVRVLYTRDRDVFVGLQARADYANRNRASLFISIHLNSAPKGSPAYGTETYVLGLGKQSSNLSVAMRENKAMLLEDNYQTTYKGFDPTNSESYIIFDLMQEAYFNRSIDMANYIESQYKRNGRSSRGVRQDGFWVLSQSAMPSVLTEVGFISHESEAQYLGSDRGQEEVAEVLSRAFSKFYSGQEPKGEEEQKQPEEALPEGPKEVPIEITNEEPKPKEKKVQTTEETPKSKASNKVNYRIQFMSKKTKLPTTTPELKQIGEPITVEQSGRLWLYLAGKATSLSKAKRLKEKVQKRYPDCFIVEYLGDKRSRRL